MTATHYLCKNTENIRLILMLFGFSLLCLVNLCLGLDGFLLFIWIYLLIYSRFFCLKWKFVICLFKTKRVCKYIHLNKINTSRKTTKNTLKSTFSI